MHDRPAAAAPGAPGITPSWTSSDKDLVGCVLGPPRLWYTIGHGIINEVYSPRIGIPQIRDLGFIVGDGQGFRVEVKRLDTCRVQLAAPGVPAVEITHSQPRFQLQLRVCPDPLRDVLLVETPSGPAWHRCNGDGYGERDDGSAYTGTGTGRAWPLLTGERGHFELAAGHDPLPLLRCMAAMAGGLGMLPEPVWDAAPIPSRGLHPSRPTGSAMPLAWAHAEFIKLAVSRHTDRIFDRPEAVWQRYHGNKPDARYICWTPAAPLAVMARDQALVIILPEPASVHIGTNGWQGVHDIATVPGSLGVHWIEFDPGRQHGIRSVEFTWRQPGGTWCGRDFSIAIADTPPGNLPAGAGDNARPAAAVTEAGI